MTSNPDLEALRALLEKATRGEWRRIHGSEIEGSKEYIGRTEFAADAELVVAAVNALPALLERAERCAKLDGLLREWLETPFFKDEAEWRLWVDDFGARVRAALRGEPNV